MRLLSDRIQEFIDWLEDNTDFGQWDNTLKTDVHKKLIEFMISDPPKCKEYRPDHNGECLNCDEAADAHEF